MLVSLTSVRRFSLFCAIYGDYDFCVFFYIDHLVMANRAVAMSSHKMETLPELLVIVLKSFKTQPV